VVAIYTRVSTSDQKQDMQISELLTYIDRMSWKDIKQYNESESSIKYRPVFEQMMNDARIRLFDTLLVYKIDRLARSMEQFISTVFELDRKNIRFISITQNIDTDKNSPAGRFLMNILAAVAEFERGIIVERINSGIAEYKKAFKLGRAKSRSGKNLPCGRPKVIVDKLKLYELRDSGLSIPKISKELKIAGATVFKLLKERENVVLT
jgi:DNA invertase Pin-like site-specific DNA recombinase